MEQKTRGQKLLTVIYPWLEDNSFVSKYAWCYYHFWFYFITLSYLCCCGSHALSPSLQKCSGSIPSLLFETCHFVNYLSGQTYYNCSQRIRVTRIIMGYIHVCSFFQVFVSLSKKRSSCVFLEFVYDSYPCNIWYIIEVIHILNVWMEWRCSVVIFYSSGTPMCYFWQSYEL